MRHSKPVLPLVIGCPQCGACYADPGGDASPWCCRVCSSPLSREQGCSAPHPASGSSTGQKKGGTRRHRRV